MHKARPAYDPGADYVARKRKAGLCICYRCQSKAGKTKSRCYRHDWQERKRRDPIAYLFYHKRHRAISRGRQQPWGTSPAGQRGR